MNVLLENKHFLKLLLLITPIFFCYSISIAQPQLPQRTLSVSPTQSIHFGTLTAFGTGGTIIIGWDGSRTAIGDIVLLGVAPFAQPAIFDIKLCQGRNVTISFAASTILTCSGGGSLILDIGPTDRGINGGTFITNSDCNFISQLRVGGTLHVPGNAISCNYTGNLYISFNQE
jgi:hypothetical protein